MQLVLIGAGRHPKTKMLRAVSQPRRRTFYLGDIHVQSGKRIPVSVDWLRTHFKAVVSHIKDGTALVQFAHDMFVDPEELKMMCFGTEEEQAAYQQQAQTAGAAGNEETPVTGSEEGTGEATGETPVEVPASQEEPTTEVAPTEETAAPEAPPATEAAVMLPPSPDTPETPEQPVEESTSEPAGTAPEAPPEPPVEQEPVVNEPEAPVAEPPATKVELPEDWQKFNKAKLLDLAAQLDIDTSDMPSNKMLITRISERA